LFTDHDPDRVGSEGWAQELPRKYRKFSPEFRNEAVRLVIDNSRSIAQVARELGVNEGTLGNWVNLYRNEHADEEPPLTPAERIQLAEAQRELRELRMENEFLKKAAAYFARDPR
jgi:transposase